MSTSSTEYLRFSAYSIKEYLKLKLSNDKKLTDHLYDGSNVSILIDLVSYMYQCFIYCLNNAAAESMFSDAQVYENINRLVKMLGYSPRGIIASQGVFLFDNSAVYEGKKIPQYSYIKLNKQDNNGKSIYYSTREHITINNNNPFLFTMYNGKWKLYSTIFTATGSEYETFTLHGLGSDTEGGKYVADGMIDVYVQSTYDTFTKWKQTDLELFSVTNYNDTTYALVLNGTDEYYNLRLNENKTYEIKFGNGYIGKKLNKGDCIYIFYLDTNGLYGLINPGDLSDLGETLKLQASDFGLSDDKEKGKAYNQIFNIDDNTVNNVLKVKLVNTTTAAIPEEDVNAIRANAPEQFKLGKRLVTAHDYEYYVKNTWRSKVIDVKCQNNFEYIAKSFYKWLYMIGVQKHNNPAYYLNEIDISKYGFKYCDPSDSNNVYLWIKLFNESAKNNENAFIEQMQNTKDLTHNICVLEPIDVNFRICAASAEQLLKNENPIASIDNNNWIEITISNNSLYNNSVIQSQVEQIIKNFFDISKQKLGANIDYNKLLSLILAINGVERVRTIYMPEPDENGVAIPVERNGISFATWSSTMIDVGDDLDVSTSNRTLEDFQFPVLNDSALNKKIKIIKKSTSNTNNQY